MIYFFLAHSYYNLPEGNTFVGVTWGLNYHCY
jgi:hypothetical protein